MIYGKSYIDKRERLFRLSKYKDIIDKMEWSYSRLSSFDHCKYEFYLNYIIANDDEYLEESNFYAEVGSYVHEILAKIFNRELTPDEASQYYVDNYNDNVFYKAKQSTMNKTFEACADYFATVDFGWLNDYEILGVEMENKFQIGKYNFVGYIDLLLRDKRDGKIVVVDHKSAPYPFKVNGGVKSNYQSNFNSYKRQMYLYSYAVKQKYDEFPKEIRWNHFKDGGRFASIPFLEEEYYETIKWFEDMIHKVEKEEDFQPMLEFFYCKNLCNFRASCEYCKMEDWK